MKSIQNILARPRKRKIFHHLATVVVKSKTAAKMANFGTVCSSFKEQLNNLTNMLVTTELSSIRCIVPNNHKKPGVVDPSLERMAGDGYEI